MNKKTILLAPVLALLASGCASVMSGTEQDIAVHTNPEGAECILTREDQELAKIVTPDTVKVSKLKHDIYVNCLMDGFHESKAHINSGTQGSVFGNMILGGGIGWAIDSARGADNKYADVVIVTMVPLAQAVPEAVNIGVDGKELDPSEMKAMEEAATKASEETGDVISEDATKGENTIEPSEVIEDNMSSAEDTKIEKSQEENNVTMPEKPGKVVSEETESVQNP